MRAITGRARRTAAPDRKPPGGSSVLTFVLAIAPTTTVLVSSPNPAPLGQSVTLTATVRTAIPGGGVPGGTVTFFEGTAALGTVPLSNGSAHLTTSALGIGQHTLTAAYNGSTQGGAPFAASTSAPLVQTVRSRYFAVAGAPGLVQVCRDSDNSLVTEFAPYGSGYTGPISVAVGDVSGDGIPDLVTGAGVGNPDVRVFDGAALGNGTFSSANPGASLLPQWFAYGLNFNVGVNVAVGDVEKDGFADVVTGATAGNPHVKVYRGKDIALHTFDPNGSGVVAQWFAYGLSFNVGANVAVGDVNGDGFADVVTGATAGNPDVRVYRGKDIAGGNGNPPGMLAQFFAYGLSFNVGATVAAADFDGDGKAEILTGASAGTPHYRVVRGNATGIQPPAVNGIDVVATGLIGGLSVGA